MEDVIGKHVLTKFTFVNSTLLLVFLNHLTYGDDLVDNMWSNRGLGNDLWYMMMFAILEPVFYFLNINLLFKYYYRWKLKDPKFLMTQKEMNKVYEGPDFNLSQTVAKYCKTIMLALFLMPIFPLSAAMAVFLTSMFYWLDKYQLLRWMKLPDYCNVRLGLALLRFFDIALIIYSVVLQLLSSAT